jgi:hypothetical protein
MAKKRLGELLIERGLIDVDQLNSALAYQRQWGHRLGVALVAKGFLAEGTLTRVLAESLQIPMVDLSKVSVEDDARRVLTAAFCEQHDVLPISIREHRGRKMVLLAMADPLDVNIVDEVGFTTGLHVRSAIAQLSSLQAALKKYYRGQRNVVIPPLNFEIRRIEPQEEMTIIDGKGQERIVDSSGSFGKAPAAAPIAGPPTTGAEPEVPAFMQSSPAHQQQQYESQPVQVTNANVGGEFNNPTGFYQVVPQQGAASSGESLPVTDDMMTSVRSIEADQLEALEKKFWALMRLLARKGIVTKESFLEELSRSD